MAGREVQRRLAAILAADVAGYTRLMEADTDGTVAAWHAARADVIDPGIAEFNGRIVKHTGDGFLAEFATAQDAVRCAVALQEGLAASSLNFRIGINLGDIIDDGEDIHGEGVNVAARLEGLAEPGGVCISGEVHALVRNRVDVPFRDLGEHMVKHVTHPVRVYAVGPEETDAAATGDDTPLLDKFSIAVLPFDNLSGDPEQEYFSDGMAEDLITDLSKISGLFVAARNSSFSFKGQMPDVKEVAAKLGVKFVLEGSVRKMGDRLRINAQLINAKDGGHVWAERYDGDMAELFDFQDRIRGEIIQALALTLTPVDVAGTARRRTNSIEAHDLFLKARTSYFRYAPAEIQEAKKYLEQAIEIDPDFAEAHSYLAYFHNTARVFMLPGFEDDPKHILMLAEKGVALDRDSAVGHALLGWVRLFLCHHEEAISSFEKALDLAPGLAETHAYYGIALNFSGEPEKGRRQLETALEIDPLSPPGWTAILGATYFHTRQYDEAHSLLTQGLGRAPGHMPGQMFLTATLVEMDRLGDAREHLASVLQANPHLCIDHIRDNIPFRYDEDRDRFLGALRKAAMPEHPPAAEGAEPPLADKPSIAVLPFDNLSGDAEQDYIGDGLTEDIIAGLSRIRSFFVIARNSTFQYKGTSPDIRRVAEELGVRYVLEGSVRKAGERIRVTAQLIDAPNNSHIWAERFDREFSDIFTVQDEITGSIVGQLEPELGRAEYERVKAEPPQNLDAWGLFHRGMLLVARRTKDEIREGGILFEQALQLEANFAPALAGLVWTQTEELFFGFADHDRSELLSNARRAVALDGKDPFVHFALSWAYFINRQIDNSAAAAEKAIEINPSYAHAYMMLARSYIHSGRPAEGIPIIETAMKLSPADPSFGLWHNRLAIAHLYLEDFETAAQLARKSLQMLENWLPAMTLAAALGHLGRLAEAEPALADLKRLAPEYPIEFFRATYPTFHTPFQDLLLDGLSKAGLPETTATSLPDKPSIAVLPFDNLSGDPEQEYFSDGITEDIITDLSKVSGLFVIARNSTFTYKGKAVDVKQVAAEMAVRYVVEGSVRKAGGRVRITAQLIDGRTGGHIWADRYDRVLDDIFEVQDEVTRNIVDALKVVLKPDEDARIGAKGTDNLEAYDYAIRGRDLGWRFTPETNLEAAAMLRKAIDLDPEYAMPYTFLAMGLSLDYLNGWNGATEDILDETLDLAMRAQDLDATDPQGYWAMAVVRMWRGDLDRASAEIERAIALEPNLAVAHAIRGNILGYAGRPAEAVEILQTAMRLDPQYPDLYLHILGHSHLLAGNYEATAENLTRRIRRYPETDSSRMLLASCYGHLGQIDAAKKVWQELKLAHPDFTLAEKGKVLPYKNPADWQRILDGLEKAGLLDQDPAE